VPQIIVITDAPDTDEQGAVMLRERINPADLESAHFRKQLIERLGWAVGDAHMAEGQHTDAAAEDREGAGPSSLAVSHAR
jgi:hypothetical protein